MGGYRMVSLRGLIVFTICRKACIYNPATRQSLTLPTFKSNLFAQQEPYKHVHYFFGHDPVLDQYKIVCSVMIASSFSEMLFSEFWVFVLEPGVFGKEPSMMLKLTFLQDKDSASMENGCLGVVGVGGGWWNMVEKISENNEVILALTCPCYLLYYDLMKNDVRKVNINRVTTPHVCIKVSNPGLSTCEAPTVVRRLLALNTHMSLQIPASFRVRRESAVVTNQSQRKFSSHELESYTMSYGLCCTCEGLSSQDICSFKATEYC
ncbi:hypothetical protein HID58_092961 [Brassica napus]|uniref:F-box associated beta-propeller type 3 domain-containing protein n=1 Tax=Brassica napus TaxID=3708 RepID=A0ABQ7XCN8_BRANA|nr:hypothetical protein HID58_092961 [Brassica napus]